MGEQTGVTTTTEETGSREPENTFKAIASQDELNKVIESRLARERAKQEAKFADYDELKAKAAKVDALEAANMSELEKAQKAATDAETARAELEAKISAQNVELLRQKVGAQFGLPAELTARLQGDDEASITADAESLKSLIPTGQGASGQRVPIDLGGQPTALNGSGIEDALKNALGIR